MKPAFLSRAGAPALALCLLSCASTGSLLPTPDEMVAEGAAAPSADLASLRRGRAVFVTECSACHRPHWPREYPPEAWRDLSADMGRRASLSEGQIADLSSYLALASRRSAGEGRTTSRTPRTAR